MQKTVQEIDDFIKSPKSNIAACVLGCGQVIENQIIEYSRHECIIPYCIKFNTKCKNCKRVLGPAGELLRGNDEIYLAWDAHDRLVKKIKERYNQTDHDIDDK